MAFVSAWTHHAEFLYFCTGLFLGSGSLHERLNFLVTDHIALAARVLLSHFAVHRWAADQADGQQFVAPVVTRLLANFISILVPVNAFNVRSHRCNFIAYGREIAHH
ncbi:hypothetical protein WT56_30120 [Burkholderia pseudomultivorans]|uniref:Uncharacterized protein n=1 Tax=Burkholderia pseudomultivorans TaxID=1207504 RepID=A0A132E987_9BURK|nr:hypothetical protein WT56_30120 [Burkholderia pseudomultivorans]